MKELVEVIASALVDSPEDVVVTETEDEKQIVLNLTVAPEDMGKVIGKQGRIAKAIRTVVKAASSNRDVLRKQFVPLSVPPVLKVTRRLWLTFNKDEACSRAMNTLRAFVCGVFCILPKRGKG